MVYEMLARCYGEDEPVDMQLEVAYAEADQTTEIVLTCGRKEYDPFTQDDPGLGVTILNKMAKRIDCRREGERNRISVNL